MCVSDDTGAKTCLTKAQLDALLAGAAGSVVNNNVGSGTTQAEVDATAKAAADKIAADVQAVADAATVAIPPSP